MNLVSVIMPCFNHGAFVAESIASIQAQTHRDFELLVIDDGSRDNAREVIQALAAQDPRIRPVLHPQNLGASRSRNDGLARATGDWVCFCDADDRWRPEKLAAQLQLLQQHPEADIAYSDASIMDETGRLTGASFAQDFPVPEPASGDLYAVLCRRNFINIQTVMLRRRCVQSGIRFDPRIRWVEDWQFWVELARRHRFVYSPAPLAQYRVHRRSTNVTQQRGIAQNRFKVFARTLRQGAAQESQAAILLYHLACALRDAGRPQAARRFWRQAIAVAARDWRTSAHCLRPLGRLMLQPR